MPASGDQHQEQSNPFLERQPRIAQWTAEQIATISAKLDKQLGPEYISSRAGPGGTRVNYLTAEKVIGLANEVFGFNGWSSSIQNIQVDFADDNPQTGRICLGLSVIVRVTLKDGTFHEDIGYGSIENAKTKAMAFEKAKKEGTTDGLKRALRSFGNVLGNCIYDKDYVSQVTKIKAQPVKKFDPANLWRQSDYVKDDSSRQPSVTAATTITTSLPAISAASVAPTNLAAAAATSKITKAEPGDSFDDYLGELDEADFCVAEDGHPDEIMIAAAPLDDKARSGAQIPGRLTTSSSIALDQPKRPPQTPNPQQPPHQSNSGQGYRPQAAPSNEQAASASGVQPQDYSGPVAFFSARAVKNIPNVNTSDPNAQLPIPEGQQLFNPKAESPSIRKTPGIDHTSSKPLAKTGQHVPPTGSQQTAASAPAPAPAPAGNASSFTPVRPSVPNSAQRGSITNPSLDQARRIGAPNRPASPLANRGLYRPPSMKRNLPNENGVRTPLADLPTGENGSGAPTAVRSTSADAKRQKMI